MTTPKKSIKNNSSNKASLSNDRINENAADEIGDKKSFDNDDDFDMPLDDFDSFDDYSDDDDDSY